MPQSFSLIGLSRKELSDGTFQTNVEHSLRTFSRRFIEDKSKLKEFIDAFRYSQLEVTDVEGYQELHYLVQRRERELNIPENRLFYLSVAPEFFDVIASNIKESGVGTTNGWKRLIIEKPFGHNMVSAQDLNQRLRKSFSEEEIYRIDHYLGKTMVQNLEALAFTNPVLQSLWNNQHIANIQITASETVGIEDRAGYYNQAGAIRDMFQNHMLQMLMMTAMHLPKTTCAADIRNEKRKVMESLRPLQKEDVGSQVVRGQYSAGEMNHEPVVGYREEPGIDSSSVNDTFVSPRLWIDDDF